MDAAKRKRILDLATGRDADRAQGIELLHAADDRELWSEAVASVATRMRPGGKLTVLQLELIARAPADLPEAMHLRGGAHSMEVYEHLPEALSSLPHLTTLTADSGAGWGEFLPVRGLEVLRSLAALRKLSIRHVDLGDGAELSRLELRELELDATYARLPVLQVEMASFNLGPAVTTLGAGLPSTRRLHVDGHAELSSLEALASSVALEELELDNRSTPADLAPIGRALRQGAPLRRVVVKRAPNLVSLEPFAGASALVHLELGGLDAFADLRAVGSLTALTHLVLRDAPQLRDLSPLAGLATLSVLDLRGDAAVTDLSALAGVTSLRVLALAGSGVAPGAVPAAIAPYCTWAREPAFDLMARRPAHPSVATGGA